MKYNKPVAIIGAGNSGLAMAAHLSLNNIPVFLWNRSFDSIRKLMKKKSINCNGVIEGKANIQLVSNDISQVVKKPELICVTTPATSHGDIAQIMAPYLNDKKTVILNPGRTFGILEFQEVLKSCKCCAMPKIMETQTIIYTCRKINTNSVYNYKIKNNVLISTLHSNDVFNKLPELLKSKYKFTNSIIKTSLGNVGMILHCLPMLLNSGWVENNKYEFKYYKDGISKRIARMLKKLDKERISVGKEFGIVLESTEEWMKRSYNIGGKGLYNIIQKNNSYQLISAPISLEHRYVKEDITCGLVPLEAIGKVFGLNLKITGLIIDIASELLNYDMRKNGRNLQALNLHNKSKDDIIKLLS